MRKKVNRTKYYCFLSALIGNKAVTTKELYQFIKETDQHFGIVSATTGHESKVAYEYSMILGDMLQSIEDTDTRKYGRSTPKIFNIAADLNDVYTRIGEYYDEPVARPIEKVSKFVEEKTLRKRLKPNRRVVENLYKVLKEIHNSPTESIDFARVGRIVCSKNPISKGIFEGWCNTVKTFGGIGIGYQFVDQPTSSGLVSTLLTVRNLKGAMLSLDSKSKEWYGSSLGADKDLNLEGKKLIPKVTTAPLSEEDKKILYLIAGIIKKNSGHSVEIDAVCKLLRENFNISVWKKDIDKLVSGSTELGLSHSNLSVTFKNGDNSWKRIREACNPYGKERLIMARIGMTEEEVGRFGLKSEILSKISDKDNIFRIYFRESSTVDRRKLLKLWRTFRGTDCFLGSEDIDEILIKMEIHDEEEILSQNLGYQIEIL